MPLYGLVRNEFVQLVRWGLAKSLLAQGRRPGASFHAVTSLEDAAVKDPERTLVSGPTQILTNAVPECNQPPPHPAHAMKTYSER